MNDKISVNHAIRDAIHVHVNAALCHCCVDNEHSERNTFRMADLSEFTYHNCNLNLYQTGNTYNSTELCTR